MRGPILVLLAVACTVLLWDDVRLRRAHAPICEDRAPAAISAPRPQTAPAVLRGYLPAIGNIPEPPTEARLMIDFFRPHPGEDVLAYRDRVLPVVKQLLEPQRQRVARAMDAFAQRAHLDGSQRKNIDDAVREAGEGMKDRIMQGVLSGEIDPEHAKAATGVEFARDLLQLADAANQKVRGTLRPDQLAQLEDFDVVDYLAFRVRWEDLLGDVVR